MATSFGLPAELAELQDDYDVLGELGRGGAAVVYRARDRALGREVAVKVVHPRPTSPDDDPVARLAREARTVAQLQHPNIVAVYAVRRLRGGGLALVMQCVPGATLKTLVQRDGPFPPERCERVLRDVAQALAYAHARGIIHRDVKPENIFLDERTGSALLADFGIARSADTDSITQTGTAMGTPFYMSPEQVDGGVVDGRSDLYSLGLVAWEMLTGERPWDGESLYNVIFKQKHEELPPIEGLRAGVPQRLQYVVERMLQKQPAARWAGAEGLLAQLGHAVLPGDYKRWQRALPGRVERHRRHADEVAVGRALAQLAGDPEVASAATQHFARPVGAQAAPSAAAEGLAPAASGDRAEPVGAVDDAAAASAAAAPRDELPAPGTTVVLDPLAHEAQVSAGVAPVYGDSVEPLWDADDVASRDSSADGVRVSRRRLAVGAGVGVAILGSLVAYGGMGFGGPVAGGDAASLLRVPVAVRYPTQGAAAGSAPEIRRAEKERPPALLSDLPAASAAPLALPTLSAGGRHTCAVEAGTGLRCWGANDRGQLGDGTAFARLTPHPVAGVLSFVGVSSGLAHTCALTRNGDVYCWGSNARGQLGDATTVQRTAPVRVAGPDAYATIAAGAAHTCGVTTDRSVRCWGANEQGQLGDGTFRPRPVPGRSELATVVGGVTAGGQHTCVRTDAGAVLCWGANSAGQLGLGASGVGRSAPGAVPMRGRATSLAAGLAHTCAALANGEVWCWGRNESGQLGDGRRANRAAPVRALLPAGVRAVGVVAGAAHSCALDDESRLWCWGRNTRGALGDSTAASRATPVRVRVDGASVAVTAGTGHTCAMLAARQWSCWGDNGDGQLGDGTRRPRASVAPVVAGSNGAGALATLARRR